MSSKYFANEGDKQKYIKFIDNEIQLFITENKLSENQAKYFGKFIEDYGGQRTIQDRLRGEFGNYLEWRHRYLESGNVPNFNTDTLGIINQYKLETLKVFKEYDIK